MNSISSKTMKILHNRPLTEHFSQLSGLITSLVIFLNYFRIHKDTGKGNSKAPEKLFFTTV